MHNSNAMSSFIGTNLPAWTVTDLSDSSSISLTSIAIGKFLIIDFWTSKCTKCPAALDKLDNEAVKYASNAVFISCALSQGSGNKEIVVDLIEGCWENMRHMFMDMEEKESAKALFGFTQVPFCVVVSPSGTVVAAGEPKTLDLSMLLSVGTEEMVENKNTNLIQALAPSVIASGFVLDEDF